eukprot:9207161-Alexandrium_andersonii.AAC.1
MFSEFIVLGALSVDLHVLGRVSLARLIAYVLGDGLVVTLSRVLVCVNVVCVCSVAIQYLGALSISTFVRVLRMCVRVCR